MSDQNTNMLNSGIFRFSQNNEFKLATVLATKESPLDLAKGIPAGKCKPIACGLLSDDTLKSIGCEIDWGTPFQPSDAIMAELDNILGILDSATGLGSKLSGISEKVTKLMGAKDGNAAAQITKYLMVLAGRYSFLGAKPEEKKQLIANAFSQAMPMYPTVPTPRLPTGDPSYTLEFKYGALGNFNCKTEVIDPINNLIQSTFPVFVVNADESKPSYIPADSITNLTAYHMPNILMGISEQIAKKKINVNAQGEASYTTDGSGDGYTFSDLAREVPKIIGGADMAQKAADAAKSGGIVGAIGKIASSVGPYNVEASTNSLRKICDTLMYLPEAFDKGLLNFQEKSIGKDFTKYYILTANNRLVIGPFTISKAKWNLDLSSLDETGLPTSGSFTIEKAHFLLPNSVQFIVD